MFFDSRHVHLCVLSIRKLHSLNLIFILGLRFSGRKTLVLAHKKEWSEGPAFSTTGNQKGLS